MCRALSLTAALCLLPAWSPPALALGECGLSCCLASAATSGVTLAQNFGLAVQYERAEMGSILNRTDELSPDAVIDRFWSPGSSFAVPTSMTMEKLNLIAAWPASARWQLLAIVPYVNNEMDMRMKSPMGMVMDRRMDAVSGLGDISVLAFYTAYADAPLRPTERLTLGFGIKTPTGDNDVRSANGDFVHAMMQSGTGSWDPLLLANYLRASYPFVAQINLFYHLSTEGDEGYEFGDQVALDLIGRYQTGRYVNLGLELNALHAGQDEDHDGNYSRPAVSMVDNPGNTGLTSAFIAPGIQVKLPNTGGSVDLKYQLPVYQDVRGYQQVVDWRLLAAVAWSF